jgi:hypothetical protein
MRAILRIHTLLSQPQPFHRPAAHQVFIHNLRRIPRLHIPIPDPLRINHHRRSVLALVQAPCLVDPHLRPQPRGLGQLIQLRVQFAFSVSTARRPRRTFRPHIMTNKHVALKPRQALFLLIPDKSRLKHCAPPNPSVPVPWSLFPVPYSLFFIPHPPGSARIEA